RRGRHLWQRGVDALAGAELAALRSLVRRPRAARLPARGPERQRHRAARLQLPLRPGLSRAPRPGDPALHVPQGRRLRGPAARGAARAPGALRHGRRAPAGRIPTTLPRLGPAPSPEPLAAAAPPASLRVGRALTILAAVVLVPFVALVMRLHSGESRLAAVAEPERALALLVGRTMDVETALTAAPAWERRLYALTLSDPARELDQAIAWYEELADYSLAPSVDLR